MLFFFLFGLLLVSLAFFSLKSVSSSIEDKHKSRLASRDPRTQAKYRYNRSEILQSKDYDFVAGGLLKDIEVIEVKHVNQQIFKTNGIETDYDTYEEELTRKRMMEEGRNPNDTDGDNKDDANENEVLNGTPEDLESESSDDEYDGLRGVLDVRPQG